MVASCSLLYLRPHVQPILMTTIFCHWIQRIQWKHLGKTEIRTFRAWTSHRIRFFFFIIHNHTTEVILLCENFYPHFFSNVKINMVFRDWSAIDRDTSCNNFIIIVIPADSVVPNGIMWQRQKWWKSTQLINVMFVHTTIEEGIEEGIVINEIRLIHDSYTCACLYNGIIFKEKCVLNSELIWWCCWLFGIC